MILLVLLLWKQLYKEKDMLANLDTVVGMNKKICNAQSKGCECLWYICGRVCFQEYVCTLTTAPYGIPNISIPVDVFDVFEAT